MRDRIKNTLRLIKRKVLTDGYAEPVFRFIRETETISHQVPDGTYCVNLSFDLEYSFNSYFWQGDFINALAYGKSAKENFHPFFSFMREAHVPANAQIVGLLLDDVRDAYEKFSEAQRAVIQSHRDYFCLSDNELHELRQPNIECGIHGYSHRLFTDLSVHEAEEEIGRAVRAYRAKIRNHNGLPSFMSFPRNAVAHTDILMSGGIKTWRSQKQNFATRSEFPLGLWFSPGILDELSLERVLHHLKKTHPGYVLHLWGHLTEMDIETYKQLLEVIRRAGWTFARVSEIMKSL